MSQSATEQQSVSQSNGAQQNNGVSHPTSAKERSSEPSSRSASYDFVGKEQLTSVNMQFSSEAAFQAPPPVATAISSVQTKSKTASHDRSGTDKEPYISDAGQTQHTVRQKTNDVSMKRTDKDVCDGRGRNVATQPDVTSNVGTRNGIAQTPRHSDVHDVRASTSSASSQGDG